MNANDLEAKVLSVISSVVGLSVIELTPDRKIEDIVHDSLMLFELITVFEQEFNRHIEYDDIFHIETIGDILKLAAKLNAENPVTLK